MFGKGSLAAVFRAFYQDCAHSVQKVGKTAVGNSGFIIIHVFRISGSKNKDNILKFKILTIFIVALGRKLMWHLAKN